MTRVLFFATILTGATFAQEFPVNMLDVREGVATADCGPPRPAPVVRGAPYSTILDPGGYWRDSQGRVRIETPYTMGVRGKAIFDPIAGFAYLLDEDAKVAHRMRLPVAGPSAPKEEPVGGVTSRAEPNPALFRAPAGYRIVDEPAPFTMKIRLK
jgi:hypothetical protein